MNMDNCLPIGTTLQNGKYKIVNVLGVETFSITYKAIQVKINKYVVIQEFCLNAEWRDCYVERARYALAEKYEQAFRNQSRVLMRFDNPLIVHIEDFFQENNTTYRILGFIEGINLLDYVKKQGVLTEREVLHLMGDVCSTILYLHKRKIVHMNVKPGNFIYGSDGNVYLIDIGLGVKHNDEVTYVDESGTPGYAPLEQQSVIDKGEFSPTIDIYALGATMYRLLTGVKPPSAFEILNDGFNEMELELNNLGISNRTIICIKKAMEHHARDRYQSVSEFAEALGINISNQSEETEYMDVPRQDVEVENISEEDVTEGEKEIIGALPAGTLLHSQNYTYEIKDVLGQGSFGITYLANLIIKGALGELNSGVKVAVKEFFMKDINGRNETAVTAGSKGGIYDKYKEKFKKESLHLSELKHPNIVKVLEAFEENNTYYYSMEYVEGMSLDAYIKQSGRIPVGEAISIVKSVGNALSFMHQHNMLHLDLKPLNIMRRTNGDIILIDFGLSKQYDEDGKPESSTTVGGGTPGYAPLEQATYNEGKGFPVTMDVYALAASFYKMLTGRSPQDASEILNEGLDVIYLEEANVSNEVIAIIDSGMSPMKRNRPQSVRAFLDNLDTLCNSNMISAAPYRNSVNTFSNDSNAYSDKKELYKIKGDNGKWGFADKTGEIIIACRWAKARGFSEGLAAVADENGKWGFIGKTGQQIIRCQWENTIPFSEGLAAVKNEAGLYGLIDKCGNLIIPYQWKDVRSFHEGFAAVKGEDDKYGYIDKSNKIVIPLIWKWAGNFNEGLAPVSNGKTGYIDKTGNTIIPCQWGNAFDFSEGLAPVSNYNEDYSLDIGYINRFGEMVIPCQKCVMTLGFKEGLAPVLDQETRKWGYIDKQGNLIIPFQWTFAGHFNKEGIALVSDGTNSGYINKKGEFLWGWRGNTY